MAPPIVYRWDDGNAPVARGERRSLCDILYACLVTGYGTKLGAGWTREYVNATFDKAVFRNNPVTGTGFYLQVDGATTTTANLSKVQAFESMTSFDDGLFPFRAAVADTVGTSNQVSTALRPWVVIADDRAFYFICWPLVASGSPGDDSIISMIIFGDIVSRYAVDPYGCVLAASHSQPYYGPNYTTLANPNTTTGSFYLPRPIAGTASPVAACNVRAGGPGASTYPGQDGLAYTPGDQILIGRPHLNDGAAYTFRGWVPGFYYPLHPKSAFHALQIISESGKSFLAIANVYYGQISMMCISLDDWRV